MSFRNRNRHRTIRKLNQPIHSEPPKKLHSGSWVGVDLDGTLAVKDHTNNDPFNIGAPIEQMTQRVKQWIASGVEVRIMTARVGDLDFDGTRLSDAKRDAIVTAIQQWCMINIGAALPVTASKDCFMVELWDDRAITVRRNTGQIITGRSRI